MDLIKMNLIKEVRNWVRNTYKGDKHLLRTDYWLKKIYPNPDKAMIVAAITHDIERSYPEGRKPPVSAEINWNNKIYCLWHGKRSAKLASGFLKRKGAEDSFIEQVRGLIIFHELGGDEKKNAIKDADSLAFLENNIDLFLSFIPSQESKESIKEKFNWMYKRISSAKAKKLALPLYKKAIEKLEKV